MISFVSLRSLLESTELQTIVKIYYTPLATFSRPPVHEWYFNLQIGTLCVVIAHDIALFLCEA